MKKAASLGARSQLDTLLIRINRLKPIQATAFCCSLAQPPFAVNGRTPVVHWRRTMATMMRSCVFPTAWGWMGLAGSERGLRRLVLPLPTAAAVRQLLYDSGTEQAQAFGDLPQRLQRYFAGEDVSFFDALDLSRATAFQRSVWRVTQSIPRGETRSYGWVARHLGRPAAARAVGGALGANPLPILIPCHRVVAYDGSLGGYAGGLALKERLLALERGSKSP